ncbi:MAG: hypothetical protein K0Q72_148 [Armatimonadetes bacterium]|jgi:hypothetical protein|nr:hypothetical protein [Armatimonadota bacterium]
MSVKAFEVSPLRSLRLLAGLLGAVGLVVNGLPARAAVKEIRLGVKGATCATCAFALRKTFTKLDGVAGAKLTTKPAYMHVQLKPGEWPDVAKMQEAIRMAGFEAVKEQIELVVTGTVERDGVNYVLAIDAMKTPMRLPLQASLTAKKLPDLVGSVGHTVQLQGLWKPSSSPSAAPGEGMLTVTELQAKH